MRIKTAAGISPCPYRQRLVEALEPRRLLSVTTTLLAESDAKDNFDPTDLISDAAGNVYGTEVVPTPNSDGPEPTSGYGNIFEIAAKTHVETTLYQFTGSNGLDPRGLALDPAGNLFGQAAPESGNPFDFEIAAGTHAFSMVTSIPTATFDDTAKVEGDFNSAPTDAEGSTYSFANSDNHSPGSVIERDANTGVASTVARFPFADDGDADYQYGNLIVDNAGNIFGISEVSSDEAADNQTTVFEIHAGKHNISTLAIVPSTSVLNEVDGLVLDAAGNLYGVSTYSGPDSGYLFKVAAGTHAFTDLVNFSGVEAGPNPNPAIDARGNLYFACAGTQGAGAFVEVSGTGFVVASDPDIAYTAPSAQSATVGGAAKPVSLGSFTDTTEPGPFNVNVNWGDGSADSNFTMASPGTITPQSHAFAKGGTGTVTVTIYSLVGAGIEKATFPDSASTNQLVFAQQPENTIAGKTIGPAVVLDVENSDDDIVTSDSSAVSIVVASGPGSFAKQSVLTVDAVRGVATFSDLLLTELGQYVLEASQTNAVGVDSQEFTIKTAPAPAPVEVLTTTSLQGGPIGQSPGAPISDAAGDLFGVSVDASSANANIYEIPARTSAVTTLAIANAADSGLADETMMLDSAGDLFLAAYGQGNLSPNPTNADGAIYELAAGSHTLTTLFAFNGTDGANPSLVVADADGDLIGRCLSGGADDDGTLFEIGAKTHVLSTLVTFNGSNGATPSYNLVLDLAGNLYGTTSAFNGNAGTLYEVSAQTHALTTLAKFSGADGGDLAVYDTTLDPFGNVFLDTTTYDDATVAEGKGLTTIYEVAAGTHKVSSVFEFKVTLATDPIGQLVSDANGNIYATKPGFDTEQGSVFEITAGSHAFKSLVTFGGTDGTDPQSLIVDAAGNVYGVTSTGGPTQSDDGTVFEINGTTHAFTTLGAFSLSGSTMGGDPSELFFSGDGHLHGVLDNGGLNGEGDLFEVSGLRANPAAPVLEFAREPVSTIVGKTMASPVVVDIVDYAGNVLVNDSAPVSLTVGSGPGQLGNATVLTVNAVHGVATFKGITLTHSGTYKLTASQLTAANVHSHAFMIKPVAETPATATAQSTALPLRVSTTAVALPSDDVLMEKPDALSARLDS